MPTTTLVAARAIRRIRLAPTLRPSQGIRRYASSNYIPIILQPSFWRSLVPKFMRRENRPLSASAELDQKSKEPNPAVFYILMSLLVGSQAIQMITLRTSFDKFSRETEVRLTLLREVIRRYQAGEEVEVEKLLGKGDVKKEKEWEEAMREIAEEELRIVSRRQKQRAKQTTKVIEERAAEADVKK